MIAKEGAGFGTPEINVGVFPFMIMALIYRNVPRKKTNEMLLLGERMSAEEAREAGIVNRVVPAEEFDAAVADWAGKLASKSPLMMRLGKDAMFRQLDMPLFDALDYLRSQLTLALSTEDIQEGVTAFFEKREPQWTGPMSVSLVALALPHLRPHARRPPAACRPSRRSWASAWGASRALIGSPGEPRGAATARTCATRAAACSRPAARWTTRSPAATCRCCWPPTARSPSPPCPRRCATDPRRRCCGSTPTATSTRPRPRGSGYLGGMAWRAPAACGTPAWRGADPAERVVLAGVRDLDPDEREAARAQRRDRDRRERRRDARGGQERPRRRARLRPPRPRRARPRGLPGRSSRARRPRPDKLYDLLEAVAEDCELVGLEVTAFEAPDDDVERDEAASIAAHVLEPLLAAIPEEAHVGD